MWLSIPCMKALKRQHALKVHCVKLWKQSLNFIEITRCWKWQRFAQKAWNQSKHIAARKIRVLEPSKPFVIRHGFKIYHAGFLFCFDPVFPHYAWNLPFCKGNLKFLFLCWNYVIVFVLFLILQGLQLRDCLDFKKGLWMLEFKAMLILWKITRSVQVGKKYMLHGVMNISLWRSGSNMW